MTNLEPVKRFISSDNSCLFNAVSYVCDKDNHNEKSAKLLRQIVATTIKNNPFKYNESFLSMSHKEYQEYILNPSNWGGAIELEILADHYKVVICNYQIQTLKKHSFGESKNYDTKVFILYDGIHYDSLVLTPDKTLSFEYDITKFDIDDITIDEQFFQLVYDLYNEGQFTDFNDMKLICLDCMQKFKNHNEAIEHAQLTGHQNMSQIE